MSVVQKIDSLEQKIISLKQEREKLKQIRREEILKLLAIIDLDDIDDSILLGGFQFIKDSVSEKTQLMEDWQNAGEKFRKAPRKQKSK